MALAQLNDNIIVCMCVNNIIILLLYKLYYVKKVS